MERSPCSQGRSLPRRAEGPDWRRLRVPGFTTPTSACSHTFTVPLVCSRTAIPSFKQEGGARQGRLTCLPASLHPSCFFLLSQGWRSALRTRRPPPTTIPLDAAFPDDPVVVTASSLHHTLWLNTPLHCLRALGIADHGLTNGGIFDH